MRSCGPRPQTTGFKADFLSRHHPVKPRRRAFRKALEELKLSVSDVAVLGDQIFTDVLGGNRMGLYTILVTPISDKEFIWTKLMRQFERLILKYLQRKNLIR